MRIILQETAEGVDQSNRSISIIIVVDLVTTLTPQYLFFSSGLIRRFATSVPIFLLRIDPEVF